ncbi:MAG TPA: hypothetical protein VK899_06465 [Gemmatimonadales bacterium]|nr:hypothetical protein [Gemmatimonadales bacterium]
MKKRIASILASLGLAAGIVAVAATPAQASFSWCTANSIVCFANDTSGNGAHFSDDSLPLGVCFGVPSGFNDTISSLFNRWLIKNANINVYRDNPCGGNHVITFLPGAQVNLTNVSGWDNIISGYCLGPRGGSIGCP